MFPLAAQDHLEVRDGVARHFAADAVEAEVGHVMLAATVEAAADLDVQVLDGFVELKTFLAEPFAQFRRQPARRGNSQLAGVRPGAGGDVHDGARAGIAEPGSFECLVQLGQIALADPAKDDVLFDRRANRFPRESARDIRQTIAVGRGDVAERQRDGDHRVAVLLLRAGVGLHPALEGFRTQQRRLAAGPQRRFLEMFRRPRQTPSIADRRAGFFALPAPVP